VQNIKSLLDSFTDWVKFEDDVVGVFLVGSYARDEAKETSDVDLIIITAAPELYLSNNAWIDQFGKTVQVMDEDWGIVKTKRAYYETGLEVEYNITTSDWIKLPPNDASKKVLQEGNKILIDKTGQLGSFLNQINLNN
jgi:predicted nucleotidyltransferase